MANPLAVNEVRSAARVASRAPAEQAHTHRTLSGGDPSLRDHQPKANEAANQSAPVQPRAFIKTHRALTTITFVVALFWNGASPFKTWAITRFGDLQYSTFDTQPINWTAPLDPVFTTKLYDQAGIQLDKRDAPKRFINVFLDFMIRARSSKWYDQLTLPLTTDEPPGIAANGAAVVDYSMAMTYCRMRMKMTETVSNSDIAAALQVMNASKPWNYFLDGIDCAIASVPEALLCVTGQNVSTFIQQQMPFPMQFNKFNIDDVQLWQDTVFPDLSACLVRRETLNKTTSNYLKRLVDEIGRNYSLLTIGRASKQLLNLEIEDSHGFLDISGHLSGYRVSQLSGQIIDLTTVAPPTSIDVAYKAFGDCFKIETKASRAKQVTAVDRSAIHACIHARARAFSPVYIGSLANTNDTTNVKYMEDYQLDASPVPGPSGSTITLYKYNSMLNMDTDADHYEYVSESALSYSNVERGYSMGVIARYLEDRYKQPEGAFSEVNAQPCIASDDCVDDCRVDTSGAWTMAFKKSGRCVWQSISQDLMNRFGYVDVDCLSLGKGSSTIRLHLEPPDFPLLVKLNITDIDVPQTADGSSIIACVLGGRKPKAGQRMPTYLYDTLQSGTGSVLVSVFSSGSEQALLGYIGLISLLGCALYALLYLFEVANVTQFIITSTGDSKLRAMRQQLWAGMMQTSFASRVWLRHRRMMVMPGFMSIMLWQLVTSRTRCSWVIPDRSFSSASSPFYQYDAGSAAAPWKSIHEIIRLVLSSYVFYLLVFHSHARGCARYTLGVLCCGVWFGFVPMYLSYVVITYLNQWRLESTQGLYRVHTMLFLGVMWLLAVLVWTKVRKYYFHVVFKAVFKPLGFDMQPLDPNSAVQSILNAPMVVGHASFSDAMQKDPSLKLWLPFSLFLESQDASLANVTVDAQTYSVSVDQFANNKQDAGIPDWVEKDTDVYVR